jgi:hypothetical protein
MTVIQLLSKQTDPPSGCSPWAFRAKKPDGTEQDLCRASFIFENELKEILNQEPEILNWEITSEYLPE